MKLIIFYYLDSEALQSLHSNFFEGFILSKGLKTSKKVINAGHLYKIFSSEISTKALLEEGPDIIISPINDFIYHKFDNYIKISNALPECKSLIVFPEILQSLYRSFLLLYAKNLNLLKYIDFSGFCRYHTPFLENNTTGWFDKLLEILDRFDIKLVNNYNWSYLTESINSIFDFSLTDSDTSLFTAHLNDNFSYLKDNAIKNILKSYTAEDDFLKIFSQTKIQDPEFIKFNSTIPRLFPETIDRINMANSVLESRYGLKQPKLNQFCTEYFNFKI